MSPPQTRGQVITGGHRDPAGVFGEARPLQAGRPGRAGCGAVPGRWRVIRAQAASSAGQARAPVPSPRRFLASAQSPCPSWVRTIRATTVTRNPQPRLGRACPCRAAARRRRELADEITTPSAESAGPATVADQDMRLCGGYSDYSEDTTADNVSSPMPRASRGYSEDTQNGA